MDSRRRTPSPATRNEQDVLKRVRSQSFLNTHALDFLSVHPSNTTVVPNQQWSMMLRRRLGVPVYNYSSHPKCAHCDKTMDVYGDRASHLCKVVLGVKHRHNAVARVFGKDVFEAAGLRVAYEVPFVVPGLDIRPPDTLVDPPAPAPGARPGNSAAY